MPLIRLVAAKYKLYLKAVRAPFFTATIIPVALGSILAWHHTDIFSWGRLSLAMLGAILIHAGTNLINDYFDHLSGADAANPNPTPFSGGSRVIQEGLMSAKAILYMASASFISGAGIGLYLNYLCGRNVILLLGVIGIALGIFYSSRPFRIGYSGLGELAVGIGFGPLMVMGSYYVQAERLPFGVFLVSIPVGILIALVLYINEFPDYAADKSVGKKTLVVILGRKNAVLLYHLLLTAAYLSIIALIIYRFLPIFSAISILSAPLAAKAFLVSRSHYDKIYELLPANAYTIGLHFVTGLLLCAGLMIDKVF